MANRWRQLTRQPLWLVGFRPFFALAFLSGLALPVLWALVFSGTLIGNWQRLNLLQWHAHEMFFGFGWAVMGGFLLTATKNWVGVRGFHGGALIYLVLAWGLERLALWNEGLWPGWLFWPASQAFLGSIVVMLLWTLIRYRKHDSYRDNILFLLLLPAFLVAKNLLLSPEYFAAGVAMTVALFRLAFLIMLERTLTQFVRAGLQLELWRHPLLDAAIKLLALALVVANWLPAPAVLALESLLVLGLLLRFVRWHPLAALQRIELGVMYLGYLGIIAHLLLDIAERTLAPSWVGSMPLHVFTFGVIGLIVPAMLIRIVKGHTGRKVLFDQGDRSVLYLMLLAFLLRILMSQVFPAAYLRWIELSAACWFAAFAILAWRYLPFVLQPRVDGREH